MSLGPVARRISFERTETASNTLYRYWQHQWMVFLAYLIFSIACIVILPFSETLDMSKIVFLFPCNLLNSDVSLWFTVGGWAGLLSNVLYFFPVKLSMRPFRIGHIAMAILTLSLIAFAADILIFAGIIWHLHIKSQQTGEEDHDYVLWGSLAVLIIHAFIAIAAFAKSIIAVSYEIPPIEHVQDDT